MDPWSIDIDRLDVSSYEVPTEQPEGDGTLEWDHTGVVVVEVSAGETTGLGWTYSDNAAAVLIDRTLREHIEGFDPMHVQAAWGRMQHAVRNIGSRGIAAGATSAVDVALWDLKSRLLGVSLVDLFGALRDEVPVYASGGFTTYDDETICAQLGGWVDDGIEMVKMKIAAASVERDLERVAIAREAIGPDAQLFVDANGAYRPKQALAMARALVDHGVTWFEEPVTSDDLDGLRLLREQGPPTVEMTAGEYGWDQFYFRRMLEAGAVDVLQADATRCGGYTGFLLADALCRAHHIDLSAHTAPALHLPVCAAAHTVRHVEWFFDHVRIERIFFDGVTEPRGGRLVPQVDRPGHGLRLKRQDVHRYAVGQS